MEPNSPEALEMFRTMGVNVPSNSNRPYGGQPKFVQFVPGDKGEFLADIFFEDPRTHNPKPGPLGQIHAWGLYPYVCNGQRNRKPDEVQNWPNFDGIQATYRSMRFQTVYDDKRKPESQFMKVILDRKRNQLKSVDFNGRDKCDILCKIKITAMKDNRGEDRVWRRFRVSGGISLAALQDKAIAPIMGWVRNLHCYTFTDYRDGSLFGPQGSDSIDRQHIAQVGYDYLPDDKYKFAHLFEKEGDEIGYLYDFGDKWFHSIEILKIFPQEESTGAIEIIDGKGMCPGENLHGSLQFEVFLNEYDQSSALEKLRKKRKILDEPNYKGFGKPPSLFDPAVFDLEGAKERLAAALSSPSSVRSGAKKFTNPIGASGELLMDKMDSLHLKKGQSIKKQYEAENAGYWHETTSTTRESRKEAVCASCGKPAAADVDLKTCSGCRLIMYCSTEHQKAHWKLSHKAQCSRKYS